MLERNVTLLDFHNARNYSEINHLYRNRKKMKILYLVPKECEDLALLSSSPVESLSLEDKVYLQKLFILNSLYKHINNGDYIADVILPFPLISSVKDWVSAKGYCIRPIPIDYSYSYIDDNGVWRWHHAEELDSSTVCNYRILW